MHTKLASIHAKSVKPQKIASGLEKILLYRKLEKKII